MSKERNDAFDVFNNSNQVDDNIATSIPAPPPEPGNITETGTVELHTEQLNSGPERVDVEKTEESGEAANVPADTDKTLLQKVVPAVFLAFIAIGAVIFILLIFFPTIFSDTSEEMPAALQDTQLTQAQAANDHIDNLKKESEKNRIQAEQTEHNVQTLQQQFDQLTDKYRLLDTNLKAALLANSQNISTIAALRSQLSKYEVDGQRPAPGNPLKKISSTKTYTGVTISSIYRNQVWLREGQKVTVLTEGDIFRKSTVINIDPVERTVTTSQGVIK